MMCCNGRFIAWELKRANIPASPLQKYFLDHINDCGGYAKVVHPDNFEEEYKYLVELCEK